MSHFEQRIRYLEDIVDLLIIRTGPSSCSLKSSVLSPFRRPFTSLSPLLTISQPICTGPVADIPSLNSFLSSNLFPTSTLRLSTNLLDDLPDDFRGDLLGYGILNLTMPLRARRATIYITVPSLLNRPVFFADLLSFAPSRPGSVWSKKARWPDSGSSLSLSVRQCIFLTSCSHPFPFLVDPPTLPFLSSSSQ
ncbi:hypothetical protein PGT21_008912 [Puccinia graminis f. sp. tritici]|uniref:Uncharacterized protein n=1 Tax=Puccinia graminis f. sp. tritici TaxID=56615 RepID=A0A5B0LV24_PUCGR|nr:hypothetical protein PGT21_008912 [Puccinia graminis f. sp. tritici]